jgi:hypothetical protein
MMGTLVSVENVGAGNPNGSIQYRGATYLDDNGIQQTGISLTAVGWHLSCFNGLWVILDNGGNPHVVQGGQASCLIASITPDKDEFGAQEDTGTLTYTNLVINPPFIRNPSQPLVAWLAALDTWGWVKPFSGGG